MYPPRFRNVSSTTTPTPTTTTTNTSRSRGRHTAVITAGGLLIVFVTICGIWAITSWWIYHPSISLSSPNLLTNNQDNIKLPLQQQQPITNNQLNNNNQLVTKPTTKLTNNNLSPPPTTTTTTIDKSNMTRFQRQKLRYLNKYAKDIDMASIPPPEPFKSPIMINDGGDSNNNDFFSLPANVKRIIAYFHNKTILVIQIGDYPQVASAFTHYGGGSGSSASNKQFDPAQGDGDSVPLASVYLVHQWCLKHNYAYLYLRATRSNHGGHKGPFPNSPYYSSLWTKVPNALYAFELARISKSIQYMVMIDGDVVPRKMERNVEGWFKRIEPRHLFYHVLGSSEFAKYSFASIYPHVNSGAVIFRITPQGKRALWSWWFEVTQSVTPEELKRHFVEFELVIGISPSLPKSTIPLITEKKLNITGMLKSSFLRDWGITFDTLEQPGFMSLRKLHMRHGSERNVIKLITSPHGESINVSFVVMSPYHNQEIHADTMVAWTSWFLKRKEYIGHLILEELRSVLPWKYSLHVDVLRTSDIWGLDYLSRDHPGDQERFQFLFWRNYENAFGVIDDFPIQSTSFDFINNVIPDEYVLFEHACCPKPKWTNFLRYSNILRNMTLDDIPNLAMKSSEPDTSTWESFADLARGDFGISNLRGGWQLYYGEGPRYLPWVSGGPKRFDGLRPSLVVSGLSCIEFDVEVSLGRTMCELFNMMAGSSSSSSYLLNEGERKEHIHTVGKGMRKLLNKYGGGKLVLMCLMNENKCRNNDTMTRFQSWYLGGDGEERFDLTIASNEVEMETEQSSSMSELFFKENIENKISVKDFVIVLDDANRGSGKNPAFPQFVQDYFSKPAMIDEVFLVGDNSMKSSGIKTWVKLGGGSCWIHAGKGLFRNNRNGLRC
jgi:hypothetical protein